MGSVLVVILCFSTQTATPPASFPAGRPPTDATWRGSRGGRSYCLVMTDLLSAGEFASRLRNDRRAD